MRIQPNFRGNLSIERAVVYAYLACVLVLSIGTNDSRSHYSPELWQLQPVLGFFAKPIGLVAIPAIVGALVFPWAFLILAFFRQLSWPAVVTCVTLVCCSLLAMVPAIQ